jgi:hypothetical protein
VDPARARRRRLVEREVGRVEEHHMADLGIQRVEPELANRGRVIAPPG